VSNRTEVRLRFKDAYAADFFLGQLSDGWGENHVRISPVDGQHHTSEVFDVEVYSDWGGEAHEITDEASDRQEQAIAKLISATDSGGPDK
jgi:hypothetical protein